MAKEYSLTIHIKSDFDIDSILKGLRLVEAALSKTTSIKGKFELAGVSELINTLEKALQGLKSLTDKGFRNEGEVKAFTKELDKAVNSINDIQTGLQKVALTSKSSIGKQTEQEVKRFEEKIKDAKKALKDFINTSFSGIKLSGQPKQKLINSLMGGDIDTARSDLKKFYEEANKELDALKRKAENSAISEATSKIINKATLFGRGRIGDKAVEGNAIDKTVAIEQYKNLLLIETGFGSSVSDAIKNIYAGLAENIRAALSKTKLEDVIRTDYQKIVDAITANTGKYSADQKAAITNQEGVVSNLKAYLDDPDMWKALGERITTATNNITNFTDKVEKANAAEQATYAAVEEANSALIQQDSTILNATTAYSNFRSQLIAVANLQKAIDTGFSLIINRLKYFASATTIFHYIRRAINQTYNDVKTLDKSFAQIAMVTKYTVNDMWRSYDQYAAMANKLGQATNDVIQASALYYQQGLDTAEALTLTEDTMKLATLASIDFAEATDLMTSALRGFKLEMDEGAHVTDVYSELAAHAAANVQEIAVAMNKTSAIAASAGMSFENTAAFVTQMIETTQESAANIGTALKTVIARFTELKENVDELDSDFEDLEYNKVDAALQSIGINLKDDVGLFRDLDDVFLELASTWNNLSRNQLRYIATTAAGSRQQSRFIALMSDYSRTLELVETAQNAQGRSSEQFAKYADSVEYSVKQLQNTWEQFRVNLANNDFYKSFIDGLNSLLSKISDFDSGDWTKFILGWATLGRLVVNSFLTGMQNAISSITPAILSSFNRMGDAAKTGTTNWFLNLLMGYRPKKSITSGPEYEAILKLNNKTYGRALAKELSDINPRINQLRISALRDKSNLPSFYFDNKGNLVLPERRDSHTKIAERYQQEIKELEELTKYKEAAIARTKSESLRASGQQAALKSNEELLAKLTTESAMAIRTLQIYAAGQAAAGAFMSAFTASMMTEDPGAVLKASLIGGTTAAIPGIMNTFTTALSKEGLGAAVASAGKAGLWAAIAVLIVGGVAWGIKKAKAFIKEQNEKDLLENSEYYLAIKLQEALADIEEKRGNEAYKASAAAEKSADAYDKLASKTTELEELRSKTLLTADEEERLVLVQNELAEIAPEIVSYYDEEGNAVIDLKDSYTSLIEEKKKLMLIDQEAADKAALGVAQTNLLNSIEERKEAEALVNEQLNSPIIQAIKNFDYNRQFAAQNDEWAPYFNTHGGSVEIGEIREYDEGQGRQFDFSRLYKFNPTEVETAGKQLKALLLYTTGFEQLQSTEDKDVVAALMKLVSNSDNVSEMMKKLQSALGTVSDDYELLDYAIRAAGNEYLEAGKQELSTKLALKSDFYGSLTDLNVLNLITDYLLKLIGTSWDLLEAANPQGAKETYYDWQLRLAEKAAQALSNVKIDDKELADVFTPAVISIVEQITNGSFSLEEQDQMMLKTNSAIYDIWKNENEIWIKGYNERLLKIAEIFGISVSSDGTISKPTGKGSDLVLAVMDSLHSDNFVSTAEKWINAERTSDFAKTINGLTAKEISEVFSINWDDLAVAEYSGQIKALAKAIDKNPEDVEKIVKTLGLFDAVSYSTDLLKDEVKGRMEAYKKYDKTILAYRTAGESWAKNGKVSAAGIEALYDAGFDVSKFVGKDLQLDADALKKEIYDTLMLEIQSLLIKKQQTQELLNQYKIVAALNSNLTYTASELEKMGLSPDTISKLFTKNGNVFTPLTALAGSEATSLLEVYDSQDAESKVLFDRILTLINELDSASRDMTKDAEDRAEKIKDAQEAVKDAYEDVLKKLQDVIDKQKALDETLYGTPYHKNKLEELYNYTTALDVYTDQIEEAKEALDDLRGADPAGLIDEWMAGVHNKAANLTATNNRYETAINATRSTLENELVKYLSGLGRGISTNVSDYFYYDPTLGRYGINYGALNSASMNDDLKDFIEEQVDLMNQYAKSIKDNQKELKNLEKEFIEYLRKARDDYIDVLEEIAKVLEEYYQQQIEDKKEMYDALEEADNEYLDALEKAIEKERKLRDKEEKWSQLATKEKKLSLLQRDTSGSNQKAVQQLQKDIRKDRQSLLDDSVDSIIEDLKELYETQKETREIELEYQEAMLENANYIAEANSLLLSWKTVDEMREWMWAHTQDIDKMSDEAIEKMTEDWELMFDTILVYNEMSLREIASIFEVSGQEVQDIVTNTSETLTTESARALNEISTKVTESIQNAELAVSDAMRALADALDNYNEKIRELNQLIAEMGNKIAGIDLSPLTTPETTLPILTTTPLAFNNSGNIKITNIPAALPNDDAIVTHLKNTYGEQYVYGYLPGDGWYAFDGEGAVASFVQGLPLSLRATFRRYKKGGLVDYTGPAYVDGSPSAPEAFLDAKNTLHFIELNDILSTLASGSSSGSLAGGIRSTVGDTSVQMNIYVDSIATPELVDYLLDRMEERFVQTANPIGTSVILRQ